jgi:hypothetical protein
MKGGGREGRKEKKGRERREGQTEGRKEGGREGGKERGRKESVVFCVGVGLTGKEQKTTFWREKIFLS